MDTKKRDAIIKDLSEVVNRHSLDTISHTPDYIIAGYLYYCWESANYMINLRESWFGRKEIK